LDAVSSLFVNTLFCFNITLRSSRCIAVLPVQRKFQRYSGTGTQLLVTPYLDNLFEGDCDVKMTLPPAVLRIHPRPFCWNQLYACASDRVHVVDTYEHSRRRTCELQGKSGVCRIFWTVCADVAKSELGSHAPSPEPNTPSSCFLFSLPLPPN
jgi:hypothetical protein